jgi:ribosomal peptide maturation radical SAM protein 1
MELPYSTAENLRGAIVIPPFASIDRPALGPHLLKAAAAGIGWNVDILYANAEFAALVSANLYKSVASSPPTWFMGERVFARAAWNTPSLGWDSGKYLNDLLRKLEIEKRGFNTQKSDEIMNQLNFLSDRAMAWVPLFAEKILKKEYAFIGFSSTFQQKAATIALSRALKKINPHIALVLGGANCEAEMAEGEAENMPWFDAIFSGEAELEFTDWLLKFSQPHGSGNEKRRCRIIPCSPAKVLDTLPIPDFSDFLEQVGPLLKTIGEKPFFPMETSRGCWWADKNPCRFCGLNPAETPARSKSPQRVMEEMEKWTPDFGAIAIHDSAMPEEYPETLLPLVSKTRKTKALPEISWEIRTNHSFSDLERMFHAGIRQVQAGVESLSTPLLKIMGKGSSGRVNVNFLRNCRTIGIEVCWNALWCLPNDEKSHYLEMERLIPLIHHLQPPRVLSPMILTRFSEFYNHPEKYGISNIKPHPGLESLLPPHSQCEKTAYFFRGKMNSFSQTSPKYMNHLESIIEIWQKKWCGGVKNAPIFHLHSRGNLLQITDTRGLGSNPQFSIIDQAQAICLLTGWNGRDSQNLPFGRDEQNWALSIQGVFASHDSTQPLITCSRKTMERLKV